MKKRKFASGGDVEGDSVYERAKRFLRNQGISDDTPALDEKIASARMGRGETVRTEIPSRGDSLPMTRENTVEPEAVPETSRIARSPVPRSPAPPSPAPTITRTEIPAGDGGVPMTRETTIEADPAEEARRARGAVMANAAASRAGRQATAAARNAQSAAADASNVAEDARGRLMSNTNRMGVRAAQQMEDKGSIYSPDFGKPRAVREAEDKARRMPLPRSQRMFQGRRKMERPTEPGGFAKGGSVSSASSRADGIAKRGRTRGRVL